MSRGHALRPPFFFFCGGVCIGNTSTRLKVVFVMDDKGSESELSSHTILLSSAIWKY